MVLGRALRHRNYRLFFVGQGTSLFGTWLTKFATAWMAYQLTGSVFMLGLVAFASHAPTPAIAPIAGVLVDRWDRRRVIVITQVAAGLQSAALAVFAFTGTMTVWHLMVLGAVQGAIVARCLARDPKARFARVEDVLAPRRMSRRWFLAAGGLAIAATGVAAWRFFGDDPRRGLAANEVVAVMPRSPQVFADAVHTAITIDLHDLLTTVGVPVVEIYGPAMDTLSVGPALKWAAAPDPRAAAFAFPHVANVVQHAVVRSGDRVELVLEISTRDGKRERRFARPADEVALLHVDAALLIAELAGQRAPRSRDPVVTPEHYQRWGDAVATLYRRPQLRAHPRFQALLEKVGFS